MVRRALDREVERDLDARRAPGLDHRVELLPRPEAGVDRVVAALGPADRPRAAGVAGLGDERVVAALPVRRPDRVHRRQVDDVEAELRELRQHLRDAAKPAPGAREQLVPGAEARPLPIDVDLERLREGRLAVAVGLPELRGASAPLLERAPPEQRLDLGRLAGEVDLLGGELAIELVEQRRGAVDPRLDRVLPAPELRHLELARPVVVAARLERALDPLSRARRAVANDGVQDVVPVLEDVGGQRDAVADRSLHRVAPAVDLGAHVLDLDARRLLRGGGRHGSVTFSDARTVNSG
jgi:hypothetical protein